MKRHLLIMTCNVKDRPSRHAKVVQLLLNVFLLGETHLNLTDGVLLDPFCGPVRYGCRLNDKSVFPNEA